VIGQELQSPAILAENIYNMDETGVLLSVSKSLEVLVSNDDPTSGRGAEVKRTLVTAIEYFSASGKFLPPSLSGRHLHIGVPGRLKVKGC
jgi:hypothetical protein